MKIPLERSRQIFNNPSPPKTVSEKQFDGFDNKIKNIAKKNWKDITDSDLWYYFHDLAYVDLQQDLFQYLFPVCLNFWYTSLMRNASAALGDSDFHRSLYRGQILQEMTTPQQTAAIYEFFHDGFIERIEEERGFVYAGSRTPAYAWMKRFNSIGYVAPIIDRIWTTWWTLDHPGKAVSAIMYASGLVYLKGENPIFGEWTPQNGGGGPYLTSSDSHIYEAAWHEENIQFLRNTLCASYIINKLHAASESLQLEPESRLAAHVAADALEREDIISIRIDDLIEGLSKPETMGSWEA